MANFKSRIQKFVANQAGATMLEYGLIAALLSVVTIVAMGAMGVSLADLFNTTSTGLNEAEAAVTSSSS